MKERDYRGVTYDHPVVLTFSDLKRLPNGFKILEAHGFPRLTTRMDGNLVWAIRVLIPSKLPHKASHTEGRVAWFDAMTFEYISEVCKEDLKGAETFAERWSALFERCIAVANEVGCSPFQLARASAIAEHWYDHDAIGEWHKTTGAYEAYLKEQERSDQFTEDKWFEPGAYEAYLKEQNEREETNDH